MAELVGSSDFITEPASIWSERSDLADQHRGPITEPANKLTPDERRKLIAVATSAAFIDVSPHQIVPRLADRSEYYGSEATISQVLKAERLQSHRGSSKRRQVNRPTKPCQVFSWDITYLPTPIAGRFFYLYLFLHVFSRKAVGWKVHYAESAKNASELITEISLREGIEEGQLATYADNGGSMKGATMQITMSPRSTVSKARYPAGPEELCESRRLDGHRPRN